MVFPLKTAILDYYRNLTQSKTVIFMKGGVHSLSKFTKTDMIPYKVFELGIIS